MNTNIMGSSAAACIPILRQVHKVPEYEKEVPAVAQLVPVTNAG
jgi:hypothetical protein